MLCNSLLCYDDGDNDKDGAMRTTTGTKTMTKMILWHCSQKISELNPGSLKHRAPASELAVSLPVVAFVPFLIIPSAEDRRRDEGIVGILGSPLAQPVNFRESRFDFRFVRLFLTGHCGLGPCDDLFLVLIYTWESCVYAVLSIV